MSDLAFSSAVELARALREKQVSSREVLDHYLDRIDRLNAPLNAVVTVDADAARAAARAADDAIANGVVNGPLHGLPMTVKDTLETAGMRTTAGVLRDHVPDRDADAVARLRAAGAIVFGKTNTPPYAGDAQTYNAIFGVTNNPWDVTRTPGGSSGGAAAALAAGLTGLEVGSDIGGSIRNPAHFCGVFGLKPSYGLVSSRGHIPLPPGSLSIADVGVVGPLGRTADDLALALDVLAGPDEHAAVAWRLHLPEPRATALRDYRIAAWLDDLAVPVDAAVGEVLGVAVDALRDAGAKVDDKARPAFALAEAVALYVTLVNAVLGAGLSPERYAAACAVADQPPAAGEPLATRRLRGAAIRHRDWIEANERRTRLRSQWAEFFRDVDVLLCPVTATAAFQHDHSDPLTRTLVVNGHERPYSEAATHWNGAIGVSYLPSVVVPVGRTREGLPVGIQVVGPHLEDRTALDAARHISEVLGGFEPPPGY